MLKPLSEVKYQLDINPQEVSSSLRYFRGELIDWDVYLPSLGINLQRPFCWTLEQKRELINSVLIGRHIPHCSIIDTVDPKDHKKTIYQVIDGKQRLSSLIGFINNEFDIELEGNLYFFKDLPTDYQRHIDFFHFRYYRADEPMGKPFSDQQKLDWFNFLNFAGTPQDKEHLENLKKKQNA